MALACFGVGCQAIVARQGGFGLESRTGIGPALPAREDGGVGKAAASAGGSHGACACAAGAAGPTTAAAVGSTAPSVPATHSASIGGWTHEPETRIIAQSSAQIRGCVMSHTKKTFPKSNFETAR